MKKVKAIYIYTSSEFFSDNVDWFVAELKESEEEQIEQVLEFYKKEFNYDMDKNSIGNIYTIPSSEIKEVYESYKNK